METALQQIHDNNWKTLIRATVDKKHPYRNVVLASTSTGYPQLRMVILRQVDTTHRTLTFYTHYLSAKVEQFQTDSRSSCLFWNDRQKVQLRLQGTMTVHYQDELAQQYWQKVPEFRHFEYTHPVAPGTPIDAPGQRMEDSSDDHYFTVLSFEVNSMDWLELGRDGHRRARFWWVEQEWNGGWLMP